MKKLRALVASLLSLSLLFQSLSVSAASSGARFVSVSALATETAFSYNEASSPEEDSAESLKTAAVLYELTENRTAYTKEYVLSNGLHMAVAYPDPVHFEKDGKWTDIDNTLKRDGTSFTNTDAPQKILLPAAFSSSETVSLEAEGHTVSFRLLSSEKSDRSAQTPGVSAAKVSVKEARDADGKIHPERTPDALTSRLSYESVFPGMDLVYDVTPYGLKESLVIDSPDHASETYAFELNAGTLVPRLLETGEILLEDGSGKPVFSLPSPYLFDAELEYCFDVKVSLEKNEDSLYTLTYTLPRDWMTAPERVYPVVLDPAIQTEQVRSNIRDKAVYQYYNAPDTLGVIEAGKTTNLGLCRSFVKYVNLPAITSSDVVVKAELLLYYATSNYGSDPNVLTAYPVEVHKVLSSWETSTLVWSTQPAIDWTVEDGARQVYNWFYRMEITDVARGWYSGTNTGLALTLPLSIENDPTITNYRKQFWSADYSVYQTMQKPTAIIYFRNNNGLEGYWDYDGADAGRAGTGYVNEYTGNLVFLRGNLGFSGNRMPVTITHVYNLNDAVVPNDLNNSNDSGGNTFHMGYGWRTNLNQLLYQWSVTDPYTTIPAGTHYVWEDADGTDHYFTNDNGTYRDEDGLNLTLTVNGTGTETYCITDEKGNQTFFDSLGRLSKISDNQATRSSVTVTYSGNTKEIGTVTDGAGRRYVFSYSNDLLSRISYYGTGNTVLTYVDYAYTNGDLTSVTDKDNKSVYYTYQNHLLTSAEDVDGYRLTYAYSTVTETYQPYRVLSVEESDESGATSVLGGRKTYSYRHNETVVTDHDGNTVTLQFNDFGNLVSVKDDEGNALFSEYAFNTDSEKDGNTDATKKGNQLRASSDCQYTVVNLMLDHGLWNNNSYWFSWNGATITWTGTDSSLDGGSLSITSGASDAGVMSVPYTVPANSVYTFSCFVKSGNTPVYLKATDGTTTFESAPVTTGNEWKRIRVSYENASSSSESVSFLVLSETAGTFLIDAVQLEASPAANRYNLIEDGDFRYGNPFDGGSIETLTESGTPVLDGRVLKLVGDFNNDRTASETVPVSGLSGDYLTIAGWAKGNSMPLYGERAFAILGKFHYTDNTWSDPFIASFNPDSNEWQYAATGMIAEKAYTEVKVTLAFNHNANTAYFDGIQLYRDGYGYKYEFDSDNHVISLLSGSNERDEYEYTNNDLTAEILHTGVELDYTYDQYHNVLTAATDTGLTYSFTYDAFGNNTAVSVTDGNETMTASATYSTDGNRLETTTDAKGNVTTYEYDPDTGLLLTVQYPNDTDGSNGTDDTRAHYSYDTMYRLVYAFEETEAGQYFFNDRYYDGGDRVEEITTATTGYEFSYGVFSLRTAVSIGNRTLASYSYTNDRNHYLSSLTYGNGDSVSYTRDGKGRVLTETYEDGETVEYLYDPRGTLVGTTDSSSGTSTRQDFDFIGRVSAVTKENAGFLMSFLYEYEENGTRLTGVRDSYDGHERGISYVYDSEKRLTSFTHGNGIRNYVYDDFERLSSYETKHKSGGSETSVLSTTIGYVSPSPGLTTNQVASVRQETNFIDDTFTYTYDGNGNLVSVSDGTYTTTYVYDSSNELIRENNEKGNFTHTWTYDDGGNIRSRKAYAYTTGSLTGITPLTTVTYGYGDTSWRDLLTSYDGHTITYDTVGNPLSDGTWTYTWKHGRELAGMTDGSNTWTFTYDASGYRTERTDQTTTWRYGYADGLLRYMEIGNAKYYLTYAPDGTPMGIEDGSTAYYFETNLQGDVIGILLPDGTRVVEYSYDAWGNLLSRTGTMANGIGTVNPIRYRGYVYDEETGLYYLGSRYYNPEVGRFLNADAYASTGQGFIGDNMFAYCGNEPVIYADFDGFGKTYVIYYDRPGKGFQRQAVQSPYYNFYDSDVFLIGVTTTQEFIDAWNGMSGEIDYVYLYLHGGKGVLYFYNEDMSFEGPKGFTSLNEKKVEKKVYLLSCKGGAGTKKKNVALMFLRLTGSTVEACTGKVSYTQYKGKYYARKAFGFGEIREFSYEDCFIAPIKICCSYPVGSWFFSVEK